MIYEQRDKADAERELSKRLRAAFKFSGKAKRKKA